MQCEDPVFDLGASDFNSVDFYLGSILTSCLTYGVQGNRVLVIRVEFGVRYN